MDTYYPYLVIINFSYQLLIAPFLLCLFFFFTFFVAPLYAFDMCLLIESFCSGHVFIMEIYILMVAYFICIYGHGAHHACGGGGIHLEQHRYSNALPVYHYFDVIMSY